MHPVFQRPRQVWLVVVFALILLATCVVAPLGGAPGARAAGGPPRPGPSRRATATPPRPGSSRRTTAMPPGTIAYTRNYSELHLIQPDATNDHVIWTEPVGPGNSLDQLSWRPD